jgi:hypothetical protein
MARVSADTLLQPAEFIYIAEEVQKDYPTLNLAQLKQIINNGIKGRYDEDGYNVINIKTIYRWLKKGEAEIRKLRNQQEYNQMYLTAPNVERIQ